MELRPLNPKDEELYARAFSLYEAAFPVQERRDAREHQRVMENPDYRPAVLLEKGQFLGIVFYWETEGFIFLEHFATLPALRNQGIGARALAQLKAKGKPILLEIEPPEDELTNRRYGFYRRNGFVMNPHRHIQPKYHRGDPDLELKILSYPAPVDEAFYRHFRSYLSRAAETPQGKTLAF